MSDDERLDRAERIKQLRQGRRGGQSDDRPSDAQSDGDGSDSTRPPAEGAEDENAEPEREDGQFGADPATDDGDPTTEETAAESDPERSAAETNDGTDGAATEASTTGEEASTRAGDENEESTQDDEGDTVSDERDDGMTGDDNALSAAQAAAQAAAEFEGEGVSEIDAGEDGERTDAEETDETAAPAGATIAGTEVEETTAEETRVLEFRLGEERYCLDIEYVEEIVREETVTRVPNTPKYVEGVVDLRGQITTILDPTVAADIEVENDDRLIVVFDPDTFDDYGEIGWLVDAVEQVSLIAESDVKEPPMDETYVNGVIERDDEFVIWTTPELALDVTEEE